MARGTAKCLDEVLVRHEALGRAARMWVVMKLERWSSLEIAFVVGGRDSAKRWSVGEDPCGDGAIGFLPVFGDYDAALARAGGPEDVLEIEAKKVGA